MPKVTIEFNLPEEQEEFDIASKASDMSLVIWEFSQRLRTLDKYGINEEDPKFKDVPTAIETIRQEFTDMCFSYNVNSLI